MVVMPIGVHRYSTRSDVLAGTVVTATSVIRLTQVSDVVAHIEASTHENHHEAATSKRTLTPAETSKRELTASRN